MEGDKAGRCDNFLANNHLVKLSEYYDAGIRNGTFHKASKFDKAQQEITLKTGKGGNREKNIANFVYRTLQRSICQMFDLV